MMKALIVWAIALGVLAYGGAKFYLHSKVSEAMDTVVLMMSPFARVDYDGVASTMTGELTVEGVTIRIEGFRDEIRIDRIGIDTPSFFALLDLSDMMKMQGDSMPEYFGFLVEGLHMPVDADYYQEIYNFTVQSLGVDDAEQAAIECTGRYGFSPRALAALGYKEQVISMSMTFRDQPSKYLLEIVLNIDDMWDLDASISLDGDMMTELSKGTRYRPKLSEMRLVFTDRSLKQRVTKYCGQRGLSPEEVLTAQMDAFRYSGTSSGIEFDEYLLDPYREFLECKSTLVVTAQPTKPVAFSQIDLYKPSDVPALLNLAAIAR